MVQVLSSDDGLDQTFSFSALSGALQCEAHSTTLQPPSSDNQNCFQSLADVFMGGEQSICWEGHNGTQLQFLRPSIHGTVQMCSVSPLWLQHRVLLSLCFIVTACF